MSNTSLNKVDTMHRYVNDLSMSILLASVLAAGFLTWVLFYKKKTDPVKVSQSCAALATASGKITRVVDGQCQMEIVSGQWHTINMD